MTEYVLVGGPSDGRRVATNGMRILRIPVPHPITMPRKVVPFDPVVRLALDPMDIAEYELVGGAYRYEGLIGDARVRMDVSRELWSEPGFRRVVRGKALHALQSLAPEKVIDGVIWRMDYDRARAMFGLVAFVGGRRVENGLRVRWERRQALFPAGIAKP